MEVELWFSLANLPAFSVIHAACSSFRRPCFHKNQAMQRRRRCAFIFNSSLQSSHRHNKSILRENRTVTMMKSSLASLLLVCSSAASLASAEVLKLDEDNYRTLTEGKTVFLKMFAPWVSPIWGKEGFSHGAAVLYWWCASPRNLPPPPLQKISSAAWRNLRQIIRPSNAVIDYVKAPSSPHRASVILPSIFINFTYGGCCLMFFIVLILLPVRPLQGNGTCMGTGRLRVEGPCGRFGRRD